MHRQLRLALCRSCSSSCVRRWSSAHAALVPPNTSSDVQHIETISDAVSSGRLPGTMIERRVPLGETLPKVRQKRNHRKSTGEATSPSAVTEKTSSLSSTKRGTPTEKEEGSRRSPLEPNKIDLYLASLRAAGKEPSLADVDRCKPHRIPSGNSVKYPELYNDLIDRLCRTFDKNQLRLFGQQYGLDGIWTRTGRRKVEYAESIIEKAWGWPNLKELERQKRDVTEVISRVFPVTASELFLLLGTDGAELLQISLDYNVHISVNRNPLALRVEGLRGALKKLDALIATRKKDFIEEIIELPSKSPIRSDLLQRISRLASAFIENIGFKGKVRICASSAKDLVGAKRLAIRTAAYDTHTSNIPYLAYLPPDLASSLSPSIFPHAYSLYPFLPQRSLPWTMTTGSAFRVRRVGEWLGEGIGDEGIRNGGLSGGEGTIIHMTGISQNLKETFLDAAPRRLSQSRRLVTASTGHVLFTSREPSPHPTLIPPLAECWQIPRFIQWLKEDTCQRLFVPSLPAPLHNTTPSEQTIIHRLLYRSSAAMDSPTRLLSTKVIKFEMTVDTQDATDTARIKDALSACDTSVSSPIVGDYYPAGDHATSEAAANRSDSSKPMDTTERISQDSPRLETQGLSRCSKGDEVEFDLSLPDRPLDMRLAVFDAVELAHGARPHELQAYYAALKAFLVDSQATQPDPPLHIIDGDDTYTLESSVSVRKSTETVHTPMSMPDLDLSVQPMSKVIDAVTESILDLETNQKSMSCELSCEDVESDEEWLTFLSKCDWLTTLSYRPNGGILKTFKAETDDFNVLD